MTGTIADRWNERYSQEAFAYGTEPNQYFRNQIDKLPVGAILFPAEGEGRNAVYAAKLGWKVSAFDISSEGKNKALKLAADSNVSIDYQVGELQQLNYQQEQFDAIALIYAHFPPSIKSAIHQSLGKLLRKGGVIIFEAFSKKHLDYVTKDERVGGPKDADTLFSLEEIKHDFPNYSFVEIEETEIELSEGLFHNGKGSVIHFLAVKQ